MPLRHSPRCTSWPASWAAAVSPGIAASSNSWKVRVVCSLAGLGLDRPWALSPAIHGVHNPVYLHTGSPPLVLRFGRAMFVPATEAS